MIVRMLSADELELIVRPDILAEVVHFGPLLPERYLAWWRQLYATARGCVIGLFDAEQLVGAIGWSERPDTYSAVPLAVEEFWFVNAALRGRGYGRMLLEALEHYCTEQSLALVMPSPATPTGRRLGALYATRGYREVETYWARGGL